jgi:hypothetical protein
MPNEASGQGDVLVGRIRRDGSDPSGRSLALFVAGDPAERCGVERGADRGEAGDVAGWPASEAAISGLVD